MVYTFVCFVLFVVVGKRIVVVGGVGVRRVKKNTHNSHTTYIFNLPPMSRSCQTETLEIDVKERERVRERAERINKKYSSDISKKKKKGTSTTVHKRNNNNIKHHNITANIHTHTVHHIQCQKQQQTTATK